MSTIFPKWTNHLPAVSLLGVVGGLTVAVGGVWYYFTPKFWRVGYMPMQPALAVEYETKLREDARAQSKDPQIPGKSYPGFSHQIHAGKLGMDCRYCHSHVEESAEANIPSVSTCMGCHAENHVNGELYAKNDRVQFIRDAWAQDKSLHWRRIHKVPDYVRNFPHHIHVKAGVSCFSCHGNIMEQPQVHQVQPLSMSWCLDCHRNPTPNLVPPDKVTDLYWVRDRLQDPAQTDQGAALLKALETKQMHLLPENCGACHY